MALTPRDEFRIPILQALARYGGKRKLELLYDAIEEIMAGILTQNDMEYYQDNGRTAELKWHTSVRAERYWMVKNKPPLLLPPDPRQHGVWQWTEEGRKLYEKNC
ncbi:hypothetical protein Pan258_51590 [Symmachiella dynata]|uniref:hypothetical protein n=1 Tax=Symmachiella dynata TaxID=2527995 RepID=UPI00118A5082|nr:hypothetical protein [Symmachiella dynata]QDT51076.1 hypothetical protein Pan258_51590 [Symmachiella dynata]